MPVATTFPAPKEPSAQKGLFRRGQRQKQSNPQYTLPPINTGFVVEDGFDPLPRGHPGLPPPDSTFLVQHMSVSVLTPANSMPRQGVHAASPPSPTPYVQRGHISEISEEGYQNAGDEFGGSQSQSQDENQAFLDENRIKKEERPSQPRSKQKQRDQQQLQQYGQPYDPQHDPHYRHQPSQVKRQRSEMGRAAGRFGAKGDAPKAPRNKGPGRGQQADPRNPPMAQPARQQHEYSGEEDIHMNENVESDDPMAMNSWRDPQAIRQKVHGYHHLKKPSMQFPDRPDSTSTQQGDPTAPQHLVATAKGRPLAYPSPLSRHPSNIQQPFKSPKQHAMMESYDQVDEPYPNEMIAEDSYDQYHGHDGAPDEFEDEEEGVNPAALQPFTPSKGMARHLANRTAKVTKAEPFDLIKFSDPFAPLKSINIKALWNQAAKVNTHDDPFEASNALQDEVSNMAAFLQSTMNDFEKLKLEMDSAVQRKKEWTSRHEKFRARTAKSLNQCDPGKMSTAPKRQRI